MRYEDIVEAQRNRDAKDAGSPAEADDGLSVKALHPRPRRIKDHGKQELEEAQVAANALGMGDYCSVLQF